MKKLTKDQIKHIAKLANLHLTKKEIEKFRQQLGDILAHMEMLNKLDTLKVKPTLQTTGLKNVFREDEMTYCLSAKEALSGTKSKKNNYFKIEAIF